MYHLSNNPFYPLILARLWRGTKLVNSRTQQYNNLTMQQLNNQDNSFNPLNLERSMRLPRSKRGHPASSQAGRQSANSKIRQCENPPIRQLKNAPVVSAKSELRIKN